MKKVIKILLIITVVIAVLICGFFLLMIWGSKQPAVRSDYYENVSAAMPLEQKYTAKGEYDVSYAEYDADNERLGQFKIWYPSEMENSDNTYPLVVMANGTGVKASRYEAIFEHLASRGFIVIGNEDESSWDGVSCAESLDLMLKMNGDENSIFFGKIDIENIGAAGHSQGGVGALNAVTSQENSSYYKAVYTASTTHIALAEALSWHYDVSEINIPYFMTAGTLQADAGDENNAGIAPLQSLKENYSAVSDEALKVMARRAETDHGDMLANADGYMTAWFMYILKDDEEAGRVFIGDNAEILNNPNWQDIQKNF